jgi:hypothetical protein
MWVGSVHRLFVREKARRIVFVYEEVSRPTARRARWAVRTCGPRGVAHVNRTCWIRV